MIKLIKLIIRWFKSFLLEKSKKQEVSQDAYEEMIEQAEIDNNDLLVYRLKKAKKNENCRWSKTKGFTYGRR